MSDNISDESFRTVKYMLFGASTLVAMVYSFNQNNVNAKDSKEDFIEISKSELDDRKIITITSKLSYDTADFDTGIVEEKEGSLNELDTIVRFDSKNSDNIVNWYKTNSAYNEFPEVMDVRMAYLDDLILSCQHGFGPNILEFHSNLHREMEFRSELDSDIEGSLPSCRPYLDTFYCEGKEVILELNEADKTIPACEYLE